MRNLLIVMVVTALAGVFGAFLLVSPAGAQSAENDSAAETEGQVMLLGTPGIFPDGSPLLSTSYYKSAGPPLSRIQYVQAVMAGFDYSGTTGPRACFELNYFDRDRVQIFPPGAGTSLCINSGDVGFVIQVLGSYPLSAQQGRAIIAAPMVVD